MDIIKLGRVRFRIKELKSKMDDNNTSSINNSCND